MEGEKKWNRRKGRGEEKTEREQKSILSHSHPVFPQVVENRWSGEKWKKDWFGSLYNRAWNSQEQESSQSFIRRLLRQARVFPSCCQEHSLTLLHLSGTTLITLLLFKLTGWQNSVSCFLGWFFWSGIKAKALAKVWHYDGNGECGNHLYDGRGESMITKEISPPVSEMKVTQTRS